jgi:hypothetical protein
MHHLLKPNSGSTSQNPCFTQRKNWLLHLKQTVPLLKHRSFCKLLQVPRFSFKKILHFKRFPKRPPLIFLSLIYTAIPLPYTFNSTSSSSHTNKRSTMSAFSRLSSPHKHSNKLPGHKTPHKTPHTQIQSIT